VHQRQQLRSALQNRDVRILPEFARFDGVHGSRLELRAPPVLADLRRWPLGHKRLHRFARVATAAGMFRIIGDRHYATDVIVGSAMGFSLGYIYPWLLH
jgi:hypothetical protein